jgi:hypothetical protein
MIINIKDTIDTAGNTIHLQMSYPLKDAPAKLTVDGRGGLIAVVCL